MARTVPGVFVLEAETVLAAVSRTRSDLSVPRYPLVPALLIMKELILGWTLLFCGIVIAVPAVLVLVLIGTMVVDVAPVT